MVGQAIDRDAKSAYGVGPVRRVRRRSSRVLSVARRFRQEAIDEIDDHAIRMVSWRRRCGPGDARVAPARRDPDPLADRFGEMEGAFELICEVEPATQPDLMKVRHQVGVLAPVATRFLIPDNHIGRATVSSIAVAHEVALMGGRAIACVNARDRNVLGFRRDLLTASAYGVGEVLFVYGDRPETGRRSDDLTVRKMMDLAREFSAEQDWPLRIGVSCGLGTVQPWKYEADAWYVQVSYSADELATWRRGIEFGGAVYAGVMVIPSARMARKLSADVPQLSVPRDLVEMVDRDPNAGVEFAANLIDSIRRTDEFDGVHLVPVSRYREIAAALIDRR